MGKRAVPYARVSSDDRGKDGRNLAGQLDMCREYAGSQGWRVVAEMPEDDRGASGASFELPQLSRVREMAHDGDFDVLVVREIDRLSRSLAKQLIVEEELKRNGVEIAYVLADYDDTPEGRLMKHVRATVAEYEREKIKERMTRGRWLKVKNGEILLHGDRPPYGYRVSVDGKSLVLHESEARIVSLVFQWYAEGDETGQKLGTKSIARKLTEMGVPTWKDIHQCGYKKRGYAQWADGTIGCLLTNETYAGRWHYGKRRNPRKKNPRSEWRMVEVPPIVGHELWDQARAQKEHNKAMAKRNAKHDYLVGRRITCGRCGHKMHGVSSRAKIGSGQKRLYQYYGCAANKGLIVGEDCDMPRLRADHVDAVLWDWVKSFLSQLTALADMLNEYRAEHERANKPLIDRLAVVDESIENSQTQLGRLLDLYLAGDFPKDVLLGHKKRLESTIVALERERAGLVAHLETQELTEDQMQTIQSLGARVAEGLEYADQDFKARREVIDALDLRVAGAVENGQKVAYVRCMPGEEALLVDPSSTEGILRPKCTS